MRKIFLSAVVLLTISLLNVSCSKDGKQGPEGPEGPAGPQGPQGIAGNANVTQYNFAQHDFSVSATANLQVTTTADTMNRSAWFVYLIRSSGNVYPIPGFGLNGTSDYRAYWYYGSSKVNFIINKVSGTGEVYAAIRIIRIYANTVASGGRMVNDPLPDIDFTDYYAVCDYYKLPY